MAKKNKDKEKETTIENFYDLRTDAVDDLVEALRTGESKEEVSTNISEITGEQIEAKPGSKKAEFDPYRRDKLASIPVWIKAIFIKWWFAGCVCYFIMMGLGAYIASSLDLMFLVGLAMGVVVDIFVNPIYHYFESPEKEYDPYMMFPFPFKAFWTFFTNILYYLVVIILVNFVTNLINLGSLKMWLSPLVFATLTTLIDMAFIGIKDLIVYLVKRSKQKKVLQAEAESRTVADAPQAFDGESILTDSAPVDGAGGEIDEIERLRRLAESEGEGKAKNGKNKKNK